MAIDPSLASSRRLQCGCIPGSRFSLLPGDAKCTQSHATSRSFHNAPCPGKRPQSVTAPSPSQSFFASFNTFSANRYLYRYPRSLLKKSSRAERCRATGPDRPLALTARPLRDRPLRDRLLVERTAGPRSRCMNAKHPWRLRSALEPLLPDANLPSGKATVSVANHDRNPGHRHNLARAPDSCRNRTANRRAARPAINPDPARNPRR